MGTVKRCSCGASLLTGLNFYLTKNTQKMYYLREHLEISSVTNRFGEKRYIAKIEYFSKEVLDNGEERTILHVETLSMRADERALKKEALVRYKKYYPEKKRGRTPQRSNSTYPGDRVIIYAQP